MQIRRTPLWLLQGLPLLVIMAGLLLTAVQYQGFKDRENEVLQARFRLQATQVADGLERQLATTADLLRGVAGLFASSDVVDRHEFRTYVQGLDLETNYPGIQGIGYIERIPPAALASHEARVRADGFPQYHVQPAGPRDLYTAILYIEPFDHRNQRALGLDPYPDPVRRAAMDRAAATGVIAMSGRVTLVQEDGQDKQPGFLIYAPIYDLDRPVETAEQRDGALLGWAYSPLRAHDLINNYLNAEFRALRPLIDLTIYASNRPDEASLLYGKHGGGRSSDAGMLFERMSSVHGQDWLIRIEPSAARWDDNGLPRTSLSILWGGIVLSGMASLVAWMFARNHAGVARRLDDTIQANQQLADSQAALRLAGIVMDVSPGGIMVTDREHRIVSVNPAFTRITGYPAAEAIGQSSLILSATPQAQKTQTEAWRAMTRTGIWEGELEGRRKDGTLYPATVSISSVKDHTGAIQHVVTLFQDITDRRQAEDRIRHLAHHDYLTGLPNRAHFVSRAEQTLAEAKRYSRPFALLFLDLDRFKPINDTHGHEVGDAVLVEVAHRLRALLRESDMVSRQGGDEFVVLLPAYRDIAALQELAWKLCQAICQPYHVHGVEVALSVSIGIATYPEHGTTVDALIHSADSAMYRAKQHPTERVAVADAPPAG